MNRVLMLGPEEKEEIAKVLSFARENRLSLDQLKVANEQFRKGEPRAIGDDKRHRCRIPVGYRVVYSEEFHPGGLMRHLSVSVDTPGRAPNMPAMQMLMEAFGFKKGPTDPEVMTFLEEFPNPAGVVAAVNVMEKIE